MTITSIATDIPGQVGVSDRTRLMRIVCTDNLATITTAGYLNSTNLEGYTVVDFDYFHIFYGSTSATFGLFGASVDDSGIVTLTEAPLPSNTVSISGVSVTGNIPKFNNTSGQLIDSGISPTDATKTKLVMANGAVIANRIACFTDTVGTIDDNAATAINGGNIQAGLSGTAGTLASFPATSAKGSLKLTAVANTGDTVTTISNAAMGQATTVSIPDPAGATANFAIAAAALVSGNPVKASGTAGLLIDTGARPICGITASYGGGGTSNAFTVTGLTASAHGSAVIRTSANAVSIATAVPGTNTLTITFSADPGAGTTVDYVYFTASQT